MVASKATTIAEAAMPDIASSNLLREAGGASCSAASNAIFWPELGIGALMLVEFASKCTGYHLVLKVKVHTAHKFGSLKKHG
jgi:hypothetical protein